jgi:hypothetical protein
MNGIQEGMMREEAMVSDSWYQNYPFTINMKIELQALKRK